MYEDHPREPWGGTQGSLVGTLGTLGTLGTPGTLGTQGTLGRLGMGAPAPSHRIIRGFCYPLGPRGPPGIPGDPGGSLEIKQNYKFLFGVPGPTRDEKKRFHENNLLGSETFLGDHLFAHKSLLKLIVEGFERIKNWPVHGGIDWFNYGVEWPCRMPVHARSTF